MTQRQDGPGGYQTYFPLGHRKKPQVEIVKVEPISASEEERYKKSYEQQARQRVLDKRAQRTDRTKARTQLRNLFGSDEAAVKRISEAISPSGCYDLADWADDLRNGRIEALPASLEAFFKMPSRKIAETYFEKWFCQFCPEDRTAVSERLRRAANQHLLARSQQHFVNPHSEVLEFVSGMSPFLLYEIAHTPYQPSAISRLSQLLRRNGRMRQG